MLQQANLPVVSSEKFLFCKFHFKKWNMEHFSHFNPSFTGEGGGSFFDRFFET